MLNLKTLRNTYRTANKYFWMEIEQIALFCFFFRSNTKLKISNISNIVYSLFMFCFVRLELYF